MIPRSALLAAALALAGCDRPGASTAGPAPQATTSSTPPAPSASARPADAAKADLSFVRDGKPVRALSRAELEAAVPPDLNVPQSIVEYRPEPQIRAYIRDPTTFRYSSMPAHPAFSERDIDDLVAYFRAMKDRKHDADRPAGR